MNAQFSLNNMIDIVVEYSSSVKRVDAMACLNSGVVLSVSADDLEVQYFAP